MQLPVHRGGQGGAVPRPGPTAPRRPIAKFNAKVMRERVRLRAAMQERPATRPAVTLSTHCSHDEAAYRIACITGQHSCNVPSNQAAPVEPKSSRDDPASNQISQPYRQSPCAFKNASPGSSYAIPANKSPVSFNVMLIITSLAL